MAEIAVRTAPPPQPEDRHQGSRRRHFQSHSQSRARSVSIDLVAAYTEAGLAEPFAVAMARDESNSDSILDLWEADWWKQYEVTDPLVGAVLDGVLPENDAKCG